MKTPRKSAKKKPTRKRAGRPSKFSPEIAAELCRRIAEGEPLTKICRDPAMPAKRTVSDWTNARPDFAEDFQIAREEGFEVLALECLEIADDASRDTIVTDYGARPDHEWIARCKLRIETRLKLLSKWHPKRYGDKIETEKISVELEVVIGGEIK